MSLMTDVRVRAARRLLAHVELFLTFDPTEAHAVFVPTGHGASAPLAAALTVQQLLSHLPFALTADGSAEREVMRFLMDTLAVHLSDYDVAVGGGGAAARAPFIAWVVLHTYAAVVAATSATPCAAEPIPLPLPPTAMTDRLSEFLDEIARGEASAALDPARLMEALSGVGLKEGRKTKGPTGDKSSFSAYIDAVVLPAIAAAGAAHSLPLSPLHYAAYSPGAAAATLAAAAVATPDMGALARACHHWVSAETIETGGKGRTTRATSRAVRHSLTLGSAAVQLVPLSPLASEEVLDSAEAYPGAWLIEGMRVRPSHSHSEEQRSSWLLPARCCLLVPGLAMAATEISVRDTQFSGGATLLPSLDALAPPSTMLVAPPAAREALCRGFAAAEGRARSNDENAIALAADTLVPVGALYLFTELPAAPHLLRDSCEGIAEVCPVSSSFTLKWADLAAHVSDPPCGLVVLVVRQTLDRAQLDQLAAWGTANHPLLVIGSVGEWGVTQLALRFDCRPNTPATPATRLRYVDGGRAGVHLVPLDEYSVIRTRSLAVGGGVETRAALRFVEVRQRLLVIIGERPPPSTWTATSPLPTATTTTAAPAAASIAATASQTMRPPSSSSTSSNNESISGTSSGGDGATTAVPAIGFVRCAVLIGGTTPALQTERLVAFRRAWTHLWQRAVLPPALGYTFPDSCSGSCELAVIAAVDADSEKKKSRADGAACAHVGARLRAALWTALLWCEARATAAPMETAWTALEARRQGGAATTPPRCVGEAHLSIREAYRTVGNCLDALCGVALLVTSNARTSDAQVDLLAALVPQRLPPLLSPHGHSSE